MSIGRYRSDHDIKSALDISAHQRPAKDIELLEAVGFGSIKVDMDAQNRILELPFELKDFYARSSQKVNFFKTFEVFFVWKSRKMIGLRIFHTN